MVATIWLDNDRFIYHISVPQPLYDQVTNCYVWVDEDRLTLIDPGHPDEVSTGYLLTALQEMGFSLDNVKQVIYTHPHVDHMGGGAILAPKLKATHLVHPGLVGLGEDYATWMKDWNAIPHTLAREYPDSAPDVLTPVTLKEWERFFPVVGHFDHLEGVTEGTRIRVAPATYLEVLLVPGHSLYHLALYEPNSRSLFAGDFIIAHGPGFCFLDADLTIFMESIDKLAQLPVSRIIPAHGPLLEDGPAAIRNSGNRILRLEDRLLRSLDEGPHTLRQLLFDFFGGKPWENNIPPVSYDTVLTYLDHLKARGLVALREEGGQKLFYRL